jgi:hypothetical protein
LGQKPAIKGCHDREKVSILRTIQRRNINQQQPMRDEVLMSKSAILQLETIENAFIVGLLLTGKIEQAERAIVDSIHCREREDACGQRVFRRVIQWAVDPQEQRSCRVIDQASVRILPFELGCVLHLPPDLRHCYVLRILVGLSREVCAWLLHTDVEQISQRTQSAVNGLAEVHASIGGADRISRVDAQIGSCPVGTMEPALSHAAQPVTLLSRLQTGWRALEETTHRRAGRGLAQIAITLDYHRQT